MDAGGLFIGLFIITPVMIALWSVVLLTAYGVVLLVFRHAFGVELPNPFDLLPPEWFGRPKTPTR